MTARCVERYSLRGPRFHHARVWRWPELYERPKLKSPARGRPRKTRERAVPWEDDKDAEDVYDEEEEHSNITLLTLSLKSMKEERRRTRQGLQDRNPP